MVFNLDDILNDKKGPPPALDLSKAVIESKEDLDRTLEKVPDYKIKPGKVRPEEIRVQTGVHFRSTRKERQPVQEVYADPMPPSMAGVSLEELCSVDINWRMLTMQRPKGKMEEEYFSKMVSLARNRKAGQKQDPGPPLPQLVPRTRAAKRGKGQAVETRFPSCRECHAELCQGACKEYNYDSYTRLVVDEKDEKQDAGEGITALINGTPGAVGSRKQKGGPRKPGVPKARRKRKKKKTTATEDTETEGGEKALQKEVAEMSLEDKGARPKLAPQTGAHQTRQR